MPPRSSRTEKLLRGPFRARVRSQGQSPAPDPECVSEVTVTRVTARARGRRATEFGELDRSTYTCQCGFVFQAAVLTSVTCPHCGDAQAW